MPIILALLLMVLLHGWVMVHWWYLLPIILQIGIVLGIVAVLFILGVFFLFSPSSRFVVLFSCFFHGREFTCKAFVVHAW